MSGLADKPNHIKPTIIIALVWAMGVGSSVWGEWGKIEYVAGEEVNHPIQPPQREVSIEELIVETFPEEPEKALAIARCESGLRPDAWSPTQDGGVFQIHVPVHGKRLEELGLDIWDPEDNIKFARMLYDESGWRPWVCTKIIEGA